MDEEADIGSGHVGEEEENKEEEKEEKGMEGSREMIVDKPYKNTTDVDCLKPAILQFPRTPWNKEERQSGWVRFFSILVFLKGKRSRYERQPFSCQISITWLPLCFSAPADHLSKVNSLPQTMGFFYDTAKRSPQISKLRENDKDNTSNLPAGQTTLRLMNVSGDHARLGRDLHVRRFGDRLWRLLCSLSYQGLWWWGVNLALYQKFQKILCVCCLQITIQLTAFSSLIVSLSDLSISLSFGAFSWCGRRNFYGGR